MRLAAIAALLLLLAACDDTPRHEVEVPAEEPINEQQQAEYEMLVEGLKLHKKLGCSICHHIDKPQATTSGPTLFDIYMKPVELKDRTVAIRDEAYLRESILRPNDKINVGFPPAMPAYEGRITEEELNALVFLIKSSVNRDRGAGGEGSGS